MNPLSGLEHGFGTPSIWWFCNTFPGSLRLPESTLEHELGIHYFLKEGKADTPTHPVMVSEHS